MKLFIFPIPRSICSISSSQEISLDSFLLTYSLEVNFEQCFLLFLIGHDVYLKSLHALIYFISYEELRNRLFYVQSLLSWETSSKHISRTFWFCFGFPFCYSTLQKWSKFEVEQILTIFCCNYSSKTVYSFRLKTKFKNTELRKVILKNFGINFQLN